MANQSIQSMIEQLEGDGVVADDLQNELQQQMDLLRQKQQPAPEPAEAQPEETMAQSVIKWIGGGEKEESIPDLGPSLTDPTGQRLGLELSPEKAAKLLALITTTASDDRLQAGIKQILPGAQFTKDKYDNLVVVTPVTGEGDERSSRYTRFYPNRKGLQPVDVMQGAGAVTLGQLIAATGGALGMPVAGYTGGAILGATEAGIVEALSSYQTQDAFQFFDVPAGALGGLVGNKLGMMLGNLREKLITRPSTVVDELGRLKPEIAEQIREIGVDPDGISAAIAAKIKGALDRSKSPEGIARVAESEALPTPIPLTRGEAEGVVSQQVFESMAEKGSLGDQARFAMEGIRRDQAQAIQENLGQIQSGMGGAPVTKRNEGAQAIQEELADVRTQDRKFATQLFTEARAAGDAFIPGEPANNMLRYLENSIVDFSASEIPATRKIMDDLRLNLENIGDIQDIFKLRRKLVNTGAANTPERAAATALKTALDERLVKIVDDQLLEGSSDAVAKNLAAIKNYKDFANKWKDKGILNRLTEKVSDDTGERVFKEPPENVANFLFGANANRLIGDAKLGREIKAIKRNVSPESWNRLRQEAFLMLSQRATNMTNEGPQLSGVKFRNQWQEMKTKNRDLIYSLFSKDEIQTITRFASVASRATGGATNPSNTTTAAYGLIDRLFSSFGTSRTGQLATRMPVVKGLSEMFRGARAAQVTNVPVTPPAQPLAGAGGAALGSDQGAQPLYDLYGQQVLGLETFPR